MIAKLEETFKFRKKSASSGSSRRSSSGSGKATPPRRRITTGGAGEIPTTGGTGTTTTTTITTAEEPGKERTPAIIMARLPGGDALAPTAPGGGFGLGGGDVPKIILRRDPGAAAAAAARPGGLSLGNGFSPNQSAAAGDAPFPSGGFFDHQQRQRQQQPPGGALLGDMAAAALSQAVGVSSPALGSVETAASTQPPPSPLSPAGGAHNWQNASSADEPQGHQMLWARTTTGGAGAGAVAGAQQMDRPPLWSSQSAADQPAAGGVDAAAAPWWPSPGGPNPSSVAGGGSGSGPSSAASSTATTPVSNRQQYQQQQQPGPYHQYPQMQQQQQQQEQHEQQHRRSGSWNQDEALAAQAADPSTPGHSPSRSGKKWKRGQPGGGGADGGGGSPPSAVDYTQPVSLEEAQAIAAAQQHQGGGPAVGSWGSPHNQQQGPTSPPRGGPSWGMGPGGGGGGGGGATDRFLPQQHHGPRVYHHQQSAPSPYALRPRTEGAVGAVVGGGGEGRGGEYPHPHHPHPPRPPHQPHQPHQHQHPQYHPQEQRRPPLQHLESAPPSAPTSPQRGPVASHPSPGHHPSASGGGGHHQPHSHSSGDRPPQHQQHRDLHHPPAASSSSGSRAPSEILKTLLRKKACLYEPTTSHAIATVTWLVGRNLTMSRGYFTRQSLQTGVHNVVDSKIAAGAITRTKVNRCMQIILNSCFHYIIPRVDGSEEDGTAFSVEFAKTSRVGDDSILLESLPFPWTDLEVPMEIPVDQDEEEEEIAVAPKSRRGSGGGAKGGGGGGYLTSKRSVLLCFNENVRCAQDVFRCHNEFIRDAADSSNLHLSAEEWKSFFSGGVSPTSPRFGPTPPGGKAPSTVSTGNSTPTSTGISVSPASLSPAGIRPVNEGDVDAVGIQPPALTLGSAWTQAPGPTISLMPRMTNGEKDEGEQNAPTSAYRPSPVKGDVLGELTPVDLDKFRTTWCAKRYEHDPSICSFAHVEMNGGWLRRDPVLFRYSPEMCPDILAAAQVLGTTNVPAELKGCLFNRCPRGKNCDKAHSREEVQYHPDVYKKALCPSVRKHDQDHGHHHHGGKSSKQPCKLRDVCPLLHPPGSTQPKEHHHGHGHGHHHHRGKGPGQSPGKNAAQSPASTAASGGPPIPGAPMLYIEPAPPSDFDAYLQMPGLQELFRRRSATLFHYYHKSRAGHTVGAYNIFGDNSGLSTKDGT